MIRQFCQRIISIKNIKISNVAGIATEVVSKNNSISREKILSCGCKNMFMDNKDRNEGIMLGNVINLIQGKLPAFPRFPVNSAIPLIPKLPFVDPLTSTILPLDILDPNVKVGIAEPQPEKPIEKQAARLLVIRKRKMKKHQLRKLRKRMLIQWAHRRLIREQRKEKVFQAQLLAQIKEAEVFDAEKWVNDIIERSNHHAKLKEQEAFYATPEGLRVKLKLIAEKKRIKPADWKD